MDKRTIPTARAAKREFWQRHLLEQPRSGLTQRGYCEQWGLTLASFTRWRRILPNKRSAGESAFVAVAVKPSSSTTPGVSVTLPTGVRIDGVESSTVSTVAALIRAL